MSAGTIIRSEDPFADANRLRARWQQQLTLAEEAGNYELVKTLSAMLGYDRRISGVDYVDLPAAETLDQLWELVGGERVVYGSGAGEYRWEVDGIYRRLAACVSSIRRRGFANSEVVLEDPDAKGFRKFTWESVGGAWSTRHWRVTGNLRLTRTGLEVVCATIYAKGNAAQKEGRIEWTAFKGSVLNGILAERLYEVLAVIGARISVKHCPTGTGITVDELTSDEEGQYHDLHPSPKAAFRTEGARVVLCDDDYGSGYLRGDRDPFMRPFVLRALSDRTKD